MMPLWYKVLQACYYPKVVVVLDFESYFDEEFSLTKQPTIEHVTDPRFEVLGVSVHQQTQPFTEWAPHFWAGEKGTAQILDHLTRQYGQNLEGCTLVAHNAYFEACVLAWRYNIRPRYFIDTMGLHRHYSARAPHDLGTIAKEFGLPAKGDTSQFKGWTYRTRLKKARGRKKPPTLRPKITDERLAELASYANRDAKIEWELFKLLLPRFSRPQVELPIMQHTLDIWTTPHLAVDYEFGEDLASQMDAKVDEFVAATGHTLEEISGNNSFEDLMVAAMAEVGETPPFKPAKTKRKRALAIAQADPERELLLNHHHAPVRRLMEARVALKSWPNHASRVRSIISQCRAAGDRLCVPLKYHGAHTGRWSGGESINLQNLSARNPEPLINRVREVIVAPEGYLLSVADASQIEARVLAWEAGQTDLMERFANGEEIYAVFAQEVLGKPVRKPRKTDPPEVQKVMDWRRNAVGKTGVLGCGYCMGPSKVVGYTNGLVDLPMAEQIVKTYRRTNPKIVQYWKDIEDAFAVSVKYGRTETVGHCRIFPDPEDPEITVIELASGRWLRYHKPKVKGMGWDREIRVWNPKFKKYDHVYGGLLTENVIQAMSRDLLGEALLNTEAHVDGCPVALTVHDELVGVAPAPKAEVALGVMIECLSTPPAWAAGCPLAAEGEVLERYGK